MGGPGGGVERKGKGKGSSKSAGEVIKPWNKVSQGSSYSSGWAPGAGYRTNVGRTTITTTMRTVAPWTKSHSSGVKGGKGKEKGKDSVKGKDKGKDRDGGKGKLWSGGKDKGGKGKGKRKGAAPKKSQFWVRKLDEENRVVCEGPPISGWVSSYNWKQGWGFILADVPEELPKEVRDKLRETTSELKSSGKDPGDENLLYFRKPDVETNFRIKKDSLVTFQVYVDDKGCGACEVCDPDAEEGAPRDEDGGAPEEGDVAGEHAEAVDMEN